MCLCLIFNYVSCSWFSRVRYKAVSLLSKTRKENIRNNKDKKKELPLLRSIKSGGTCKRGEIKQTNNKKNLFVGEHDEEKMEEKEGRDWNRGNVSDKKRREKKQNWDEGVDEYKREGGREKKKMEIKWSEKKERKKTRKEDKEVQE